MKTKKISETCTPYFFIIPVLLIILPFLIYPIFRGIMMSFYETNGLALELGEFVGFDNYKAIFSSQRFINSLLTTLLYTVCCLFGALLVGLGTALLLNKSFKGRTAARVAITTPWAVPEVAVVMIWVFILDPNYGVANFIFSRMGLIDEYIGWLNNTATAFPSVIAMTIWKIFPFLTIVILTALQAVPTELYEVATIDGAGRFQTFRKITLPLIQPTLMLLGLLTTIWSFKRFTIIWLATQGGPVGRTENLVILTYKFIFKMFKSGMAAAVGVMGLLVTLLITLVFFHIQKRAEEA